MISHTRRAETEYGSLRCPVCRKMIGENECVMYAESREKEVVIHERCAGTKNLSAADLCEILGFFVSYCIADELDV
ncbi:MAG: hypothetical protein IKI93_07180 [Clostridia bacterium]|nr:hypothetical protein [Clostridia bacterium]